MKCSVTIDVSVKTKKGIEKVNIVITTGKAGGLHSPIRAWYWQG